MCATLLISTRTNGQARVARYGHTADLFFTPREHVNHIYVRTSSYTCERGVLRALVKVDVRTSTMSTFARRTRRAHVYVVDVRTWSEK